jgi:protein-S-isoprenylcysteine O-methyltransferase Ste14
MTLDSSNSIDRGGRWVAAQFALMALIVVAGFLPPGWPDNVVPLLPALGAMLAVLGGIVVVWAWQSLGQRNAASPYPVPREGARLVDAGPYGFVRHPIYAAGTLFFIGFALATSPTAFVPLIALVILWRNKAQLEEDYLQRQYHEYGEYRERVPGAFLPRFRAD